MLACGIESNEFFESKIMRKLEAYGLLKIVYRNPMLRKKFIYCMRSMIIMAEICTSKYTLGSCQP
jgi:hypothetical protein